MRWVILRLQLETIKLTDQEYSSTNVNPYYSQSNNMAVGGGGGSGGGWKTQVQYTCFMPWGVVLSAMSLDVASSTQT